METILEWRSPEHNFDKKNSDWYWILSIICISAAVLAFYFKNPLFGIFIIISGITIGTLSFKETKVVDIQITAKGIVFGKNIYRWKDYGSFWIEDDHINGPRILLSPSERFLTIAIIPVGGEVDLNDLRDLLLEFMDEEFIEESMIHKWFDKILAR